MRPGRKIIATNDLYAAGPDAGDASKVEPLTIHEEDGYYRGNRPSPAIWNWLMNRATLAAQFAAKMFASNWPLEYTDAGFGAANLVMGATAMRQDTNFNNISAFFFDDTAAGGNPVIEENTTDNNLTWTTPARSPVLAAPGVVVTGVDAAADEAADMTIVTIDAPLGAGDWVYYSTGVAVAYIQATIVGAPTLDWQAIGCDRDTAGGAGALFCIGDDGAGAGAIARLYTAIDPTAATGFVVNASFSGLAIAEPVLQIAHSCHPADALGPEDPGNPSWLALTTTRAVSSADGVTWINAGAHGLGTPNHKSVAYSRTEGRWVGAVQGGGGTTRYSDDNGATWSAGGALPGMGAGGAFQCKCDGFGTFVIKETTSQDLWVSADDGLTWMRVNGDWGTLDECELEVATYSANNWNDYGAFGTFFVGLSYDDGTTTLTSWRSLIY